jgi:hypothetical protein
MKKLMVIFIGLSLLFLFSVNVHAGGPLNSFLSKFFIASPHKDFNGLSLDEWMEAYIRWLEDGADPEARINGVAFLDSVLGNFEVEVKWGTGFVLPVATYLGFPEDPPLPDDWFGDPDHVYGTVYLNGIPLINLDENYYVGPSYLDPPAILFGVYEIAFYQALACNILPLPIGVHEIRVVSGFADSETEFDNTWIVTVLPWFDI